jgi:RNA polymerase sigma-70 factor (ECF subfamily)
LEELAESPPELEQSPATPDRNLHLDLTEALKLLNSNERAAVVLCCQNGLSHEEAARVLDCPLGTVKSYVLRGREKLRRRLAPAYEKYESA